MRITRVLVPERLRSGEEWPLPDGAAERVVRVLRLAVGRELHVFDGAGNEFEALLIEASRRGARVRLGAAVVAAPASPLRVLMVQALARGEKMDLILQKATELGVSAIQPVSTERSEVRLDAERSGKRLTHWRGVIIGACEQCGRADLPVLHDPMPLRDWLAAYAADAEAAGSLRLFMDPYGASLPDALPSEHSQVAVIVIGPEGGFGAADVAGLQHAGFKPWRLGPRVLRTETAGLAALAVLQSRWGDLKHGAASL